MLVDSKKEITKEELLEILENAISIYIEIYDTENKRYHRVDLTEDVLKFDGKVVEYNSRSEIAFICYNLLNVEGIDSPKILSKALITQDSQHKTYEYYRDSSIENNWFNIIIDINKKEDGKEEDYGT